MRFLTSTSSIFDEEHPGRQVLARDLTDSELRDFITFIVQRLPNSLPMRLWDQFAALWPVAPPTQRLTLGVDVGSEVGPWIIDVTPAWLSVDPRTDQPYNEIGAEGCGCPIEPCEHSRLVIEWNGNPRLSNWLEGQTRYTELTAENSEQWLSQ